MRKFILGLVLVLFCTSCYDSMWTGKDVFVVTEIKTEDIDEYKKLGCYLVTAKCIVSKHKKEIKFNTDSIYNPGDTLRIERK